MKCDRWSVKGSVTSAVATSNQSTAKTDFNLHYAKNYLWCQ